MARSNWEWTNLFASGFFITVLCTIIPYIIIGYSRKKKRKNLAEKRKREREQKIKDAYIEKQVQKKYESDKKEQESDKIPIATPKEIYTYSKKHDKPYIDGQTISRIKHILSNINFSIILSVLSLALLLAYPVQDLLREHMINILIIITIIMIFSSIYSIKRKK